MSREIPLFQDRIKSISLAFERHIEVYLVALAGTIGTIGYNFVVEPWWNSSQYALERLAQYDKPHISLNVEERQQIISDFDEIFEEHWTDYYSDYQAARIAVIAEEF